MCTIAHKVVIFELCAGYNGFMSWVRPSHFNSDFKTNKFRSPVLKVEYLIKVEQCYEFNCVYISIYTIKWL